MRIVLLVLFQLFFFLANAQETACDSTVLVANVITGNGDEEMQTFKPLFKGEQPVEYNFTIYNRWGNIAFATIDPNQGWNGRWNNSGKPLADGTYYWMLNYRRRSDTLMKNCEGYVQCIGLDQMPFHSADTISCDTTLWVPNAVGSEDDDFLPRFDCPPAEYEMWIYDRWGNQVFYTDDYQKGWNFNSPPVQMDTYIWKIKVRFNGGKTKRSFIGHLSVIR